MIRRGIKLYIIGYGQDNFKVKKMVIDLQIEDSVKFIPFLKNPFPYVKNAKFCALTSRHEGFPMVLVEALACGTPAIVSKLGSMEEIIEDGVTGLHFDKNNEQDLQKKVAWLVDNPDLLNQMSKNARSEYLSKYTPDGNYRQLMEIYDAAIHDSRVK